MTKKFAMLFISLAFAGNLFSQQVTDPVKVDETRPVLKTDTIKDGKRIYLTRKFIFGTDTVQVEAGYKYLNPNDFSFYYQELEEKVGVSLNGTLLTANNENHKPTVHAYDEKEIFGEKIIANAATYYIIVGKEFYCDGKECPNRWALVVNTQTKVCLDINTGFCSEKELLKLINKRSKETDKVEVPVINDCKQSAADAKWINVDKAL
ncbi:MAG: hypothetical protein P4L28_07125 [Paludibacteraceae bacterium]|nr:hypothetical protein [Paludibacteraceae bacterium]